MKKQKNRYTLQGVTLKAVKDKGIGTEGCEQCFFGSYDNCRTEKMKFGIGSCCNPRVRFIMIKNDIKQ